MIVANTSLYKHCGRVPTGVWQKQLGLSTGSLALWLSLAVWLYGSTMAVGYWSTMAIVAGAHICIGTIKRTLTVKQDKPSIVI